MKNNIIKIKNNIENFCNKYFFKSLGDSAENYIVTYWYLKILQLFMTVVVAVFLILLCGCSHTTTKYYPVSVPIKCSINIPDKPKYEDDVVINNINILRYAEQLHIALKVCTDNNFNNKNVNNGGLNNDR